MLLSENTMAVELKCEKQIGLLVKIIGELTGKYPESKVAEYKLKYINELLEVANATLHAEYKPFQQFERFAEADERSNSDIYFMLAQYHGCLELFRTENVHSFITHRK